MAIATHTWVGTRARWRIRYRPRPGDRDHRQRLSRADCHNCESGRVPANGVVEPGQARPARPIATRSPSAGCQQEDWKNAPGSKGTRLLTRAPRRTSCVEGKGDQEDPRPLSNDPGRSSTETAPPARKARPTLKLATEMKIIAQAPPSPIRSSRSSSRRPPTRRRHSRAR